MLNAILVATDASPASNRAVTLAADMAGRYGAELHILHVIRDMQIPAQLRKMAEVEKIEGERQDLLNFVAQKILHDASARAAQKGAETITTSTGQGDPASAIMKQAKKNKADLVVMGTRGLSKVKSMLLGSVSRKVSNLCEASCLIVR